MRSVGALVAVDEAGETDGQTHHAIPQQQTSDPQWLEQQRTFTHSSAPCMIDAVVAVYRVRNAGHSIYANV